jgi:uncharacterized protein YkwD
MLDRRFPLVSFLVVSLVAFALAACSSADSGTLNGGNGDPAGGTGPSSEALQHCVDSINAYRAKVRAPSYTRSAALESFATDGAKSDATSGQAHGHFGATGGGHGIAFAENELPGWPLKQYKSMNDLIDEGLKAMWGEGPGGGHYDNMVSTDYTQAGCGTFTTSTNDVWVTIDFK